MRTKYSGVAKGPHVATNRGKSEFFATSNGKLHGGKSPRTDVIAKKRRDKALEEIRKYQRSVDNVIPFGAFQRLVKEHVKASRPKLNLRVARQAVLALQSATEAFLVEVFQKVNLNAIHAKRVTATVADVLHLIDSDKITNGALAGMKSTRPFDTTRIEATCSANGGEQEAEGTSAKGPVHGMDDMETNDDHDEDKDEDDDEDDDEADDAGGNCADQATGLMIDGLLHSNADVVTTDDEEEGDADVATTEDEDEGIEENSDEDEDEYE